MIGKLDAEALGEVRLDGLDGAASPLKRKSVGEHFDVSIWLLVSLGCSGPNVWVVC